MTFTLKNIVPWGRSFEEYVNMFDLNDGDLSKRILGCADGPASFNAHATRQGGTVVSCDPLYLFSSEEIELRVKETYHEIMEQLSKNLAEYRWTHFKTPEELGKYRLAAMRDFLDDYNNGKGEGRYKEASLPSLPFADRSFDLALCSHFLFLYTEHLTQEFHIAAVYELCRVASEVRIFPLLSLARKESSYLKAVIKNLTDSGYKIALKKVPYEFQKDAHTMLCISR